MTTITATAAHLITDEEFRAEFNRLEAEKRAAELRQRNLTSPYEGKVWFTKERDGYGRTVRYIKTMKDGTSRTVAAVVCVPRWTEDLREKYGMERYFTNDWVKGEELRKDGRKQDEAVTQHKTLKSALAQFGCGAKEYDLYPAL